MNRTVTLPELAEAIASATGISRAESEVFLKDLFALIGEQLANHDDISIKEFGHFAIIDGEPAFRPDPDFAAGVNQPFAAFEAIELDPSITSEMLDQPITTEPSQPADKDDDNVETSDASESISDHEHTEEQAEEETPGCATSEEGTPEENRSAEAEIIPDDNIPDDTPDTAEPQTESDKTDFIPDDTDTDDNTSDTPSRQTQSWKVLVVILLFIFWGAGCFLAGYLMAPTATINTENGDIEIDIKQPDAPYLNEPAIQNTIADTVQPTVDAPEVKPETEAAEARPQPQATQAVTDTIRRDRFLTTMARQHYGLMDFWVYIYEENADKLGDPNRITPGTVVNIPPAEKYGIDRNDPSSVRKAKLKSSEIYAPYQK